MHRLFFLVVFSIILLAVSPVGAQSTHDSPCAIHPDLLQIEKLIDRAVNEHAGLCSPLLRMGGVAGNTVRITKHIHPKYLVRISFLEASLVYDYDMTTHLFQARDWELTEDFGQVTPADALFLRDVLRILLEVETSGETESIPGNSLGRDYRQMLPIEYRVLGLPDPEVGQSLRYKKRWSNYKERQTVVDLRFEPVPLPGPAPTPQDK